MPTRTDRTRPAAATIRSRDPSVGERLGALWGPRVAEVRGAAAISQATLAERCGVTQQTISKIERGLMVPLDPLKLRLALELEVSPAVLFPWPSGPDWRS